MRKCRFSEEQAVAILRDADRTTVAEAAKKHEVSDATICARRKHSFGGTAAHLRQDDSVLKHLDSFGSSQPPWWTTSNPSVQHAISPFRSRCPSAHVAPIC